MLIEPAGPKLLPDGRVIQAYALINPETQICIFRGPEEICKTLLNEYEEGKHPDWDQANYGAALVAGDRVVLG